MRIASWFDLAIDGADLVNGRAPALEPTVLVMASKRTRAALLLSGRLREVEVWVWAWLAVECVIVIVEIGCDRCDRYRCDAMRCDSWMCWMCYKVGDLEVVFMRINR